MQVATKSQRGTSARERAGRLEQLHCSTGMYAPTAQFSDSVPKKVTQTGRLEHWYAKRGINSTPDTQSHEGWRVA